MIPDFFFFNVALLLRILKESRAKERIFVPSQRNSNELINIFWDSGLGLGFGTVFWSRSVVLCTV